MTVMTAMVAVAFALMAGMAVAVEVVQYLQAAGLS